MSRVLSSDIISNTCTIEMFMVSILTCLVGVQKNTINLTKIVLVLLSISGFVLFI